MVKVFRFAMPCAGAVAFAAGCAIDDRMLTVAGGGGASGHAGAGGAAGADGGSDTAPLMVCQGTPVKAALITDFSDARAGVNASSAPDIQFGVGADVLGGGLYADQASFLMPPMLSLATTADGQALAVTANPGEPHDGSNTWLVFGFGIGYAGRGCLDANAFTGVQFTFAGSVGTCQLLFGVVFSEVQDVGQSPATGSCPAGAACYPPHSAALVPDAAGVVKVRFVDMKYNGMPTNTVDAKALTGFQWQLVVPLTGTPCAASFTIDDVMFF